MEDEKGQSSGLWKSFRGDGHPGDVNVFALDHCFSTECPS